MYKASSSVALESIDATEGSSHYGDEGHDGIDYRAIVGNLHFVDRFSSILASEKARSEGIIYPILLEVRRILNRQISLFSGEDFTVDEAVGLNGICDFLLSRSPEVLEIEAPAIVIVEAKKADLRTGFGQCIAQMVAAQQFNAAKNCPIPTIYGSVSNGTQWRFLKLEGNTVTIDLTDYPLPPVEQILGMLVWMVQSG